MPPAARIGDLHVCPMATPATPPVPHVGGPVSCGCPTVMVGGSPAARMGDMLVCVGPPDVIAVGSPTVFIGGQPAARLGDATAHGGVVTVGCPTVMIGEMGGAPAAPGLSPAEAAELARLEQELAWELAKAAVDLAGIVDPTPISDGIGAAMSLKDGDLVGAGLSLLSMAPYVGDLLGKTAKGAKAASKIKKLEEGIAAIAKKGAKPPASPKFGANDLVYGPSAGGKLAELADSAGGKTLTALPKPDSVGIVEFSKNTLDQAAKSGQKVHFDLTHMKDMDGVLKGTGKYGNTVTAQELQHIKKNWDGFAEKPKFYDNGVEVPPPWLSKEP